MKIDEAALISKTAKTLLTAFSVLILGMVSVYAFQLFFTQAPTAPETQNMGKASHALRGVIAFLHTIQQNDGSNCEEKVLPYLNEGKSPLNKAAAQLTCSKSLDQWVVETSKSHVVVQVQFEGVVSPSETESLFFHMSDSGKRWKLDSISAAPSNDRRGK